MPLIRPKNRCQVFSVRFFTQILAEYSLQDGRRREDDPAALLYRFSFGCPQDPSAKSVSLIGRVSVDSRSNPGRYGEFSSPGESLASRTELRRSHFGLDYMTTYDYLGAMKQVGIADLKARLSEHLRSVRRGQPLTVLYRDTPIARIVPYSNESRKLLIRHPRRGSPELRKILLPPPLGLDMDIVMATHDEALATAARATGLQVAGAPSI